MSIVSFTDSREEANLSFRGLNLVGTADSLLATPFNSKTDSFQDIQKTDAKTEFKDLVDGAIATLNATLQQGLQEKLRALEAQSAAVQLDLLLAKEENQTLSSQKNNIQTKFSDLEEKWSHFRGEVSTLMSQHCKDVASSNQDVQHAQLQSALLELQKEQLAQDLAEAMKQVKVLQAEKDSLNELLTATKLELTEVSKTIASQVARETAISKELSLAQLELGLANYELNQLKDPTMKVDEVIAAKLQKKTLANDQTVINLLPSAPAISPVAEIVASPSVQVEEDTIISQVQQPVAPNAVAVNIPKATRSKSGPLAAFLSSVLQGKKAKTAPASSAVIQSSLAYRRNNTRATHPGFFPHENTGAVTAPAAAPAPTTESNNSTTYR